MEMWGRGGSRSMWKMRLRRSRLRDYLVHPLAASRSIEIQGISSYE